MKFAAIPSGEFTMGSSKQEIDAVTAKYGLDPWIKDNPPDEASPHRVRISHDFLMGAHEVTVGQFKQFAEATGYKTEAERGKGSAFNAGGHGKWELKAGVHWLNPELKQTDEHPVTCVTQNDVTAFVDWLNANDAKKPAGHNYRLPTEAEWEYACRAGTETRFYFGDDDAELGEYAWHQGNSDRNTHEVSRKKPNPWGLYDMLGNVMEWCEDYYLAEYYRQSPERDPLNSKKRPGKVMRGGNWNSGPRLCRSASRISGGPNACFNFLGFRLVLVPRKLPATPEVLEGAIKARNPNYNGNGQFRFEKGVPVFVHLVRSGTPDLAPLAGLPLRELYVPGNGVKDLSPLRGMRLVKLGIAVNAIGDLSPVRGMPLRWLHMDGNPVRDLTPLEGMDLEFILFSPQNVTQGIEVLRNMKSLKRIGPWWEADLPAAEFWKQYDAGKFSKPK